jgi:hypothetical protein
MINRALFLGEQLPFLPVPTLSVQSEAGCLTPSEHVRVLPLHLKLLQQCLLNLPTESKNKVAHHLALRLVNLETVLGGHERQPIDERINCLILALSLLANTLQKPQLVSHTRLEVLEE